MSAIFNANGQVWVGSKSAAYCNRRLPVNFRNAPVRDRDRAAAQYVAKGHVQTHAMQQSIVSITLSARNNKASGTVTPIALAVLRLITRSNFRRLFDRQIDRLRAAQKARRKSGSKVFQLIEGWALA